MEISNIASHQVNFKSQTQTQTSPIEAVKTKIENMEDGEKIVAGLTGLGILGAALLLLKKPHKAKEVVEEIIDSKPVQEASQAISEAIEEKAPKIYPQVEVGHLPKAQKQQQSIEQGTQRAVEAVREYASGGNYGEIRANAKRNLSHDGKKVVQEVLNEAHGEVVAYEIAQEHKLANAVVEATTGAKTAKNARQGMQNATREQLVEKLDEARVSAQQAIENAQQASNTAQEVGTKKAKRRAKLANNQAERAVVGYRATMKKAIKKDIELLEEQLQKEINVAEQQASKNYGVGLEKNKQNALQHAINKPKRDISKLKTKPEYQRTVEQYRRNRYSGEKLLKIMENPNSSEIQKLAAQELLETITK